MHGRDIAHAASNPYLVLDSSTITKIEQITNFIEYTDRGIIARVWMEIIQ